MHIVQNNTSGSCERPSRIEYEPYKRRAKSTLASPTGLMSSSMYEVFNWGYANERSGGGFRTGKRMQFSIAGPQINIDDPSGEPNYSRQRHAAGGSVVPANGERERKRNT